MKLKKNFGMEFDYQQLKAYLIPLLIFEFRKNFQKYFITNLQ